MLISHSRTYILYTSVYVLFVASFQAFAWFDDRSLRCLFPISNTVKEWISFTTEEEEEKEKSAEKTFSPPKYTIYLINWASGADTHTQTHIVAIVANGKTFSWKSNFNSRLVSHSLSLSLSTSHQMQNQWEFQNSLAIPNRLLKFGITFLVRLAWIRSKRLFNYNSNEFKLKWNEHHEHWEWLFYIA